MDEAPRRGASSTACGAAPAASRAGPEGAWRAGSRRPARRRPCPRGWRIRRPCPRDAALAVVLIFIENLRRRPAWAGKVPALHLAGSDLRHHCHRRRLEPDEDARRRGPRAGGSGVSRPVRRRRTGIEQGGRGLPRRRLSLRPRHHVGAAGEPPAALRVSLSGDPTPWPGSRGPGRWCGCRLEVSFPIAGSRRLPAI